MNQLVQIATAVTLSLISALALATPPTHLITHNNTDAESNAYVAGTIASQHPTKAHSDNHVPWTAVKLACFGRSTGKKCWAMVKMLTNTNNPVDLGIVTIDTDTGEITPSSISGNGYTLTVNGPGETTLTQTAP